MGHSGLYLLTILAVLPVSVSEIIAAASTALEMSRAAWLTASAVTLLSFNVEWFWFQVLISFCS